MTSVVAAGSKDVPRQGDCEYDFCSSVFEMMVSTIFIVDLNAEEGQAGGRHSNGTAHPLRISPPGWEDRLRQCPGKLCLTWNRLTRYRFQSNEFFQSFTQLSYFTRLGDPSFYGKAHNHVAIFSSSFCYPT
jgi:hypothetical protein